MKVTLIKTCKNMYYPVEELLNEQINAEVQTMVVFVEKSEVNLITSVIQINICQRKLKCPEMKCPSQEV